jgi:hypothetical protein
MSEDVDPAILAALFPVGSQVYVWADLEGSDDVDLFVGTVLGPEGESIRFARDDGTTVLHPWRLIRDITDVKHDYREWSRRVAKLRGLAE